MPRTNVTLLVLAVLLLAAGAGLWWSGGDEDGPRPDPVPPPAPPVPLERPGRGQDPVLPAGSPRVVVAVRVVEDYVEPGPARVVAVRLPAGDAVPVELLAGTGASPFADGERAGAALARIGLGGRAALLRQVAIVPLQVTTVELGGRLVVRGRITDERRQPVAGARVSLGELDGAGAPREVATDPDGRWELDTFAGDGAPLLVQAAGFASAWRAIRVATDAGLEQDLMLAPECVLDVQLAAAAVELARARVFVAPLAAVAAELAQFPFFAQTAAGGAPVDEQGRATVRGLPRRAAVGVVVVHPLAPLGGPHEVRLAGERAAALVPLAFGAGRTGTVVDDGGAPVAGALVVVRPRGHLVRAGAGLRFLPPELDAVGCHVARSDAQGCFVIGGADADGAVLALRAAGHAGREVAGPAFGAEPLVLPAWRPGNLELRVLPPRAGVAWGCELDLAGGLRLVLDADQPAVVALPRAGRCDFTVATFVGAELHGERTFTGRHATGPVELSPPPPR